MSFSVQYKDRLYYVNELLDGILPKSNNRFRQMIYDAMNYSLNSPCKRLRPILLLEFTRIYSGNQARAHDFACALEMIHTYSLIHDDLPAMDDDDLRRGQPSSHIKFDESLAILAGDSLLNYAMSVMINSIINNNDIDLIKACKIIVDSAGPDGMILGQVADIYSTSDHQSIENLNFINQYKTGALLKAAVCSGAVIGGATPDELLLVEKYGDLIGQMFQMTDDLLDIEGDEKDLGKSVGSDENNNKLTYPFFIGIDQTKKIVYQLKEEAIEILDSLSADTLFLKLLTEFIVTRKH